MTNRGIQMSFVDIDDQLIGFIAWPKCIQMNIRGPDIGTAEMNIFRCVAMPKLYIQSSPDFLPPFITPPAHIANKSLRPDFPP